MAEGLSSSGIGSSGAAGDGSGSGSEKRRRRKPKIETLQDNDEGKNSVCIHFLRIIDCGLYCFSLDDMYCLIRKVCFCKLFF